MSLFLDVSDAVMHLQISIVQQFFVRSPKVNIAVSIDNIFTCQQTSSGYLKQNIFNFCIGKMRMDSSASKHHLMALQRIFLGLTVNSVAKLLKFFKILRVQSAGIVPTRL